KFVDVRERLGCAADEAVALGKKFVFDADTRNSALFELADEPPDRIEIAVAGIAVHQNRDAGRVAHEFRDLEHLSPAGFVVVAKAQHGGDREPARPDPFKTG